MLNENKVSLNIMAEEMKQQEVPLNGQQYWLLEHVEQFTHLSHFMLDYLFEFDLNLDLGIFKEALEKAVVSHSSINVKYSAEFKKLVPLQRDISSFFELINLQGMEEHTSELVRTRRIEKSINEFSLESGNLFKIIYFFNEKGKNYLWLGFHHFICDGASIRVFTNHLFENYKALQDGIFIKDHRVDGYVDWVGDYLKYRIALLEDDALLEWNKKPWESIGYLRNQFEDRRLCKEEVFQNFLSRPETGYSTVKGICDQACTNALKSLYGKKLSRMIMAVFSYAVCEVLEESYLYMDVPYHGRRVKGLNEHAFDLVGWLNDMNVFVIEARNKQNLRGSIDLILEQICAMPLNGMGLDMLSRSQNDDSIDRIMDNMCARNISFNYLGDLDDNLMVDKQFSLVGGNGAGYHTFYSHIQKGYADYILNFSSIVRYGEINYEFHYLNTHLKEGSVYQINSRIHVIFKELVKTM